MTTSAPELFARLEALREKQRQVCAAIAACEAGIPAAVVARICQERRVDERALRSGSQLAEVELVRGAIAHELAHRYGYTVTEIGEMLGRSPSAVSRLISRESMRRQVASQPIGAAST